MYKSINASRYHSFAIIGCFHYNTKMGVFSHILALHYRLTMASLLTPKKIITTKLNPDFVCHGIRVCLPKLQTWSMCTYSRTDMQVEHEY
jgi:hypothetical protein